MIPTNKLIYNLGLLGWHHVASHIWPTANMRKNINLSYIYIKQAIYNISGSYLPQILSMELIIPHFSSFFLSFHANVGINIVLTKRTRPLPSKSLPTRPFVIIYLSHFNKTNSALNTATFHFLNYNLRYDIFIYKLIASL